MSESTLFDQFYKFRMELSDNIDISSLLLNFIEQGAYKTGDRLPPERSLAADFGVSRATIRKAIEDLAKNGMVERRRGAGTYVLNMPACCGCPENLRDAKKVFREVMELRRILEPEIAVLACQRHTEDQLNSLKITVCDQQRRMLNNEEDGDLDAQFHYQLALCSGNRLFAEIIKWINKIYEYSRVGELRNEDWRQFSLRTHLGIIEALQRRAGRECRNAIISHLDKVIEAHPFSAGLGESDSEKGMKK